MSKLDEKFVVNLQNFTDSLENIVELLKEKAKSGGEAGATDNVNSMIGSINQEALTKIVADLEEVNGRSKRIENNTDKILTEVKAARNAKESGMFGTIQNDKNKRNILGGVSTIMLIASSVVAIGLAFKIVGNVNLASVVGLSVAMYVLAKTYSDLATMKNLSTKQVLISGLVLIAMSTSLLASAFILSATPALSLMQLITIGAIGISIGVATYGIMKGLSNFKSKDKWLIGVIPILIPAIASGIYMAAYVLQKMPILSFNTILSAIGISVSLIPICFAFSLLTKSLKNIGLDALVFAGLAIPLMSFGIVAAALILNDISNLSFSKMITAALVGVVLIPVSLAFSLLAKGLKDTEMDTLLFASLAIPIMSFGLVAAASILNDIIQVPIAKLLNAAVLGLALIPIALTFVILAKGLKDTKLETLIYSGIAIPILAMTIVAASYILQSLTPISNLGNLVLTSIAIGLSTLALLPTFLILSEANLSPKDILFGGIAILALSSIIMLSSQILSLGKYDKYPSLDWSSGVIISMIAFVIPVIALGEILSSGIGGAILISGAIATLGLAILMVGISNILNSGKFNSYPSLDWICGVSGSILAFSIPLLAIGGLILISGGLAGGAIFLGAITILAISSLMVNIDKIFASGSFKSYPNQSWIMGITSSISILTNFLSSASLLNPLMLLSLGSLYLLCKSIVDINTMFSGSNFSSYPSQDWVNSIILLASQIGNISFGFLDYLKMNLFGDSIINLASKLNENASAFTQPNAIFLGNLTSLLNLLNNLPSSDKANGLNSIMTALNRMSSIGILNILPINLLSSAISNLSSALDDLNTDNLNNLMKMSGSMLTLSLVDNSRLSNVLDTMVSKKDKLSSVLDEKGGSILDMLSSAKNAITGSNNVNPKKDNTSNNSAKNSNESDETTILKEISKQLDKISTKLDKIDRANSVGTALG